MVGTFLLDKHDLWAFHEDTGSEGASQIKCRFNLGYFHKGGGGSKAIQQFWATYSKGVPKVKVKKILGEGGAPVRHIF